MLSTEDVSNPPALTLVVHEAFVETTIVFNAVPLSRSM